MVHIVQYASAEHEIQSLYVNVCALRNALEMDLIVL